MQNLKKVLYFSNTSFIKLFNLRLKNIYDEF